MSHGGFIVLSASYCHHSVVSLLFYCCCCIVVIVVVVLVYAVVVSIYLFIVVAVAVIINVPERYLYKPRDIVVMRAITLATSSTRAR